jgi:hypothetical protein
MRDAREIASLPAPGHRAGNHYLSGESGIWISGAKYSPHPGAPHSGSVNPSRLGNVLPNGEDYRPHEVETMMAQLWAEYVDANPRLFEVHD